MGMRIAEQEGRRTPMTIIEAIAILRDTPTYGWSEDMKTALTMGIGALQEMDLKAQATYRLLYS